MGGVRINSWCLHIDPVLSAWVAERQGPPGAVSTPRAQILVSKYEFPIKETVLLGKWSTPAWG